MTTNPRSPDGKWMLTPNGWVFLDSDPGQTPDGQWNFTNGRFVHAQNIADEYIDGSIQLSGQVSSNQTSKQALVQMKDSVFMGDVNVTVNQGPSIAEMKQIFVDLLAEIGANTFQTPMNVSDTHRQLIAESINSFDQLVLEGADSDPGTELMVAIAANVKGDYDDSKRRLRELLQKHPQSAEADDALQVLAQISIRLSDWDEAEKWVNQAMSRFEASGNWGGLGNAYNERAKIHSEKGEYESALEMYKAAVEIAKRRDLPALHGRSLANFGFLLARVGHTSQAKDVLGESLQLARSMNNLSRVVRITTALSEIYESEGDTVNASRLLRESRADLGETDDRYILAERELAEAKLLEKRNNFQMARGRYLKAERMFSEIGVKNKQGEVCIALAALDEEAGDYTSAIGWFSKAVHCFQDPPKPADKMFCFAELGNLHLMMKDLEESIKYSYLAIELATQLRDKEQELHCLLTLCSAQHYAGDGAGARNTFAVAKNLADNHALDDDRLPTLGAKLANTQR
jgi:tetratricopeptide (TPR) repeat protein